MKQTVIKLPLEKGLTLDQASSTNTASRKPTCINWHLLIKRCELY